MVITVTVDPSWFGHPAALAEFLTRVRLLERPAPALSPAREPGDDGDDLGELLAGMDAPEAAPVAPPRPAAAPPFDGVPTTGQGLYKWACNSKSLPRVNAIGKGRGYPKLVTAWEPHQVASVYRELAEPVANGVSH